MPRVRALASANSLLVTLVGLVLVWQLWVSLSRVEALIAPSPVAVALDLVENPGVYLVSCLLTLAVALAGLCLGMALGFCLALLCYFSTLLTGLITPSAVLLRTIPVVAIIPIIARVFGYGQNTLIGVAVVISFFPAFVLISSGLRDAPPGSNDLFDALGAGRLARLRRLALPSAMPSALIALRLSAANCILVAVLSQYLIGSDGLGYQLANARAYYQPDRAWGVAVVTTALAVAIFLNMSRLEHWGQQRWR
jgi:putative hydroxymethylpyrimidine transport system permease protein